MRFESARFFDPFSCFFCRKRPLSWYASGFSVMKKTSFSDFNVRLAGFLVLSALLWGCAIDSGDIEHWKRTQKGPAKILRVMEGERFPMELRAQAALAMVEMERTDLSALHELNLAFRRLESQSPEAAKELVSRIAPELSRMMAAAGDPKEMPEPLSIRAKDAAFRLQAFADEELRLQLIADIIDFYAVDFASRSLLGDVSAEQVVRELGDPAANRLIEAMDAKMPPDALAKLAELIGEEGSDETKAKAGERLIAIEREMESKEFLEWLKEEFRKSQADREGELDEARVDSVATLNRERFIAQGALTGMRRLSDSPVVAERLLTIALAKPPADAPEIVAQIAHEKRETALLALENRAKPEHLDRLLQIALDSDDSLIVRDHAFDRIAETGSKAAIPHMWPLVTTTSTDDILKRLRWRAGELVLVLGGSSILQEFLSKLPQGARVEYEPEELEGYAARLSVATDPPDDAIRQIARSGGHWVRHVIAAYYLERRGTDEDRALLERLSNDRTATVGDGWTKRDPVLRTVGDVARGSLARLDERLKGDSKGDDSDS